MNGLEARTAGACLPAIAGIAMLNSGPVARTQGKVATQVRDLESNGGWQPGARFDRLTLHGRRQERRLENQIAAKQDYLAALKAKIGVEE
jgi:hypothetical protein